MKTNAKELIILTAGGSGGHVYPAQALAEELSKRGYDLALITDSRGRNNYKGELSKIPNYAVFAGALVGKSKLFKLKSLIKTAFGVLQSIYLILRLKPKCVVGFGGYASFPACCAAILLRVDLVIHEQNSVLSRTNRFLSRHSALLAMSFKDVKYAPKDVKTVWTGMPLRKEIIDVKASEYQKSNKLNLLVLGGSQGAKIFSDVVPSAIAFLSKDEQDKLKVVQQCRKDDLQATKQAYKTAKVEVELKDFFEDMPKRYHDSNLIVSRTGASSICEIAVVGRASVLVPLPSAADDHQTHNALMLEKAAYIFNQKDFTAQALGELLKEFIADDSKLKSMAKKAYEVAIIDCAKRFADALEKEID